MTKETNDAIKMDIDGCVQIQDEILLAQIQGGMAVLDDFGDQFSNGACVNASCS